MAFTQRTTARKGMNGVSKGTSARTLDSQDQVYQMLEEAVLVQEDEEPVDALVEALDMQESTGEPVEAIVESVKPDVDPRIEKLRKMRYLQNHVVKPNPRKFGEVKAYDFPENPKPSPVLDMNHLSALQNHFEAVGGLSGAKKPSVGNVYVIDPRITGNLKRNMNAQTVVDQNVRDMLSNTVIDPVVGPVGKTVIKPSLQSVRGNSDITNIDSGVSQHYSSGAGNSGLGYLRNLIKQKSPQARVVPLDARVQREVERNPSLNVKGDYRSWYTLVKELGNGASGTVYLAQDKKGDQMVLKIVQNPDFIENELDVLSLPRKFIDRLENEGMVVRDTNNPLFYNEQNLEFDDATGTMKVHDAQVAIPLRYAQGGTLKNYFDNFTGNREERQVDASEAYTQLLKQLARLSDERVIHNDIKPDNILLKTEVDHKGNTRLVAALGDFGTAFTPYTQDIDFFIKYTIGTELYVPVEGYDMIDVGISREEKIKEILSRDGRKDIFATSLSILEMILPDHNISQTFANKAKNREKVFAQDYLESGVLKDVLVANLDVDVSKRYTPYETLWLLQKETGKTPLIDMSVEQMLQLVPKHIQEDIFAYHKAEVPSWKNLWGRVNSSGRLLSTKESLASYLNWKFDSRAQEEELKISAKNKSKVIDNIKRAAVYDDYTLAKKLAYVNTLQSWNKYAALTSQILQRNNKTEFKETAEYNVMNKFGVVPEALLLGEDKTPSYSSVKNAMPVLTFAQKYVEHAQMRKQLKNQLQQRGKTSRDDARNELDQVLQSLGAYRKDILNIYIQDKVHKIHDVSAPVRQKKGWTRKYAGEWRANHIGGITEKLEHNMKAMEAIQVALTYNKLLNSVKTLKSYIQPDDFSAVVAQLGRKSPNNLFSARFDKWFVEYNKQDGKLTKSPTGNAYKLAFKNLDVAKENVAALKGVTETLQVAAYSHLYKELYGAVGADFKKQLGFDEKQEIFHTAYIQKLGGKDVNNNRFVAYEFARSNPRLLVNNLNAMMQKYNELGLRSQKPHSRGLYNTIVA